MKKLMYLSVFIKKKKDTKILKMKQIYAHAGPKPPSSFIVLDFPLLYIFFHQS